MAQPLTRRGTAEPVDLQAALDDWRRTTEDPLSAKLVATAARWLRRRADDPVTTVRALREDLGNLDHALARLEQNLAGQEAADAEREPFGEAWRRVTLRRVGELRGSPGNAWLDHLVDQWSAALAASAWEACDELLHHTGELGPDPAAASLLACLRRVTLGVRHADRSLVRAATGDLDGATLPANARAVLDALAVRALLPDSSDSGVGSSIDGVGSSAAVEAGSPAVERAQAVWGRTDPGAPAEARELVLAALVEACTATGRFDIARGALEPLPSRPQTVDLVGAWGALLVAERSFEAANEMFDAAAFDHGAAAVTSHLLRPVHPNLAWRTARRIQLTDPAAALRILDDAPITRIEGRSRPPYRRALVLRAKLLASVAGGRAAADAYNEVAWLYMRSDPQVALDLAERAAELVPEAAVFQLTVGEAARLSDRRDQPAGERHARLRRAREALARGVAGGCASETAWALVSLALVDMELGDSPDPCQFVERAMLVNPHYDRALAFQLSMARYCGWPRDAREDVTTPRVADAVDPMIALNAAWVLVDLEEYAEAASRLEDGVRLWPQDEGLTRLLARVRLRQGQTRAAQRLLAEDSSAEGLTLRAQVAEAAGDRETLHAIVTELRHKPRVRPRVQAWAAFKLGDLDGAVELLRQVERSVLRRDESVALALALVLLVRGRDDDRAAGVRLLSEGVRHCAYLDDLRQLQDVDLPPVWRALAGQRVDVEDLRGSVESLVVDRRRSLLAPRPPSTSLQLAVARRHADHGRHREALAALTDVADPPPEVILGLRREAAAVTEAADRLVAQGSLGGAEAAWADAAGRLSRTGHAVADVVAAFRARLGLAALERGDPDESVVELLAGVGDGDLRVALGVLVRSTTAAWALHDGLLRLAGRRDDRLPDLEAAARALPLDRVLGLRRDDWVQRARNPQVETPVQLLLGAELKAALDPMLDRHAIADVRARIAADMGVRVPGILVEDAPLMPREMRVVVYGGLADSRVLSETSVAAVEREALDALHRSLLDHLFRFVTSDEIDLWIVGWDPDEWQVFNRLPWIPGGSAERFLVASVLRNLLREGVPVIDRATILAACQHTPDRDPRRALRQVRRSLYPATAGPVAPDGPPPALVPLPPALEKRLVRSHDGLHGRDEGLADLLAELLAWRTRAVPDGGAVLVADACARRRLARLVAVERPRIYVVAQEEVR